MFSLPFIVHIGITVLTPVILLLFIYLFPAPPWTDYDEELVDRYAEEYRRWHMMANNLTMVIVLACGGIIYLLCGFVGRAYLASIQPYAYLLNLDLRLWQVGTAFVASMALVDPLLQLVLRQRLRADYRLYLYLDEKCNGYKMRPVMRVLTVIFILIGGIFSMNIATYTKLTATQMVHISWFGFQQRMYAYTDIRAIKSVANSRRPLNGKVFSSPHLLLVMQDGRRISAGLQDEPLGSQHRAAMLYLSEQSGVPIKEVSRDGDE